MRQRWMPQQSSSTVKLVVEESLKLTTSGWSSGEPGTSILPQNPQPPWDRLYVDSCDCMHFHWVAHQRVMWCSVTVLLWEWGVAAVEHSRTIWFLCSFGGCLVSSHWHWPNRTANCPWQSWFISWTWALSWIKNQINFRNLRNSIWRNPWHTFGPCPSVNKIPNAPCMESLPTCITEKQCFNMSVKVGI